MVQCDGMLNRRLPRPSVEGKPGRSSTIRYWWELKEVTRDDKLNTAERSSVVAQLSSDGLELVEQLAVHHGHFVDDQNFCTHPPMLRLLVLLDLAN